MFRNEHRWNLIFSLAWHVIKSLLHKEEFSLIFLAKKLICIGEKSVPQTVCLLLEVNKYTAELSFGSSRNTLSRSAQISTEICIKLFTRRRIKRRDRWRSFSISINFHPAILESSPQTRLLFHVRHKEITIYQCTNIYSRRNTGRPIENCDRFARIPLNSESMQVTLLITAKQKVQYDRNVALLHQLSLLLFRFVVFHYDMILIYCGVLFLRRFSAKQ